MKLTFVRKELLSGLQIVSGLLEKRNNMPILSFILAEFDDQNDGIRLTTTDLELQMTSFVPLKSFSGEKISFTLPGKKILEIVKLLDDTEDITIDVSPQKLTLHAGKNKFQLAIADPKEFPHMEFAQSQNEFNIYAEKLVALLEAVSFSMGTQDVRYYLNGVMMECNHHHMRFVASDGHRLSMVTDDSFQSQESLQIIIPRKSIFELQRLLQSHHEEITLAIGKNHLAVKSRDFQLQTTLIESKYPNYLALLPKEGEIFFVMEKQILKQALQKVAVLSHEKLQAAKFNLTEGTLAISSNGNNTEEAQIFLDVEYQAKPVQFAFNLHYLLDVIQTIVEDEIKVCVCEPNYSALITSEKLRANYIIMPLRI